MLTTGFPASTAPTPRAPVGFGSADGMPPHDAQDPIATTAPALPATSCTMSIAVRPPIMQYTPSSFVGIAPSTTQTYLPALAAIADFSAASAWWPAAANSVS
jgi:hypothetical protein